LDDKKLSEAFVYNNRKKYSKILLPIMLLCNIELSALAFYIHMYHDRNDQKSVEAYRENHDGLSEMENADESGTIRSCEP
jgi:hypothetical protein